MLHGFWIRNSIKAQRKWLVSAPQCLGPHQEDSKAGGWNCLKDHSPTSLVG